MKSRDVVQQLKEGYRMNAPDHCPDEVRRIISDCWNADPELRPSAVELFEQLDELKVAVCSAPDGQYYGSCGEYRQVGSVQGPSLNEILESSENFGYEDEASGIIDVHKTISPNDVQLSGPSTVTYEQYRILETENRELENEIRHLKKENENLRGVNETLFFHDKEHYSEIDENIDCNKAECRAIADIEREECLAPTHDTNEIIETSDL